MGGSDGWRETETGKSVLLARQDNDWSLDRTSEWRLMNMLYSPMQLYTYICRKIIKPMTNEHASLETYTSHTLFEMVAKGLMCERWVGDWINCNILTPSSFVFSSTSFSFCWAAQSGVPRAHSLLLGAGCLYSILSPSLTPTNWTSCCTGLYHCLTSTCFLWASHQHPIQLVHNQNYTLISSTGWTCSLIDGLVEGQYVTEWC